MWDPVSKQPHFKYAAVSITKINEKKTVVGEIVETIKEKINL
jgi:hypothetical protein